MRIDSCIEGTKNFHVQLSSTDDSDENLTLLMVYCHAPSFPRRGKLMGNCQNVFPGLEYSWTPSNLCVPKVPLTSESLRKGVRPCSLVTIITLPCQIGLVSGLLVCL